MSNDVEFWRLPTVMQKVGLSKSEIYRRISDNRFPKSRRYPDSDKTYWVGSEVVEWQQQVLGMVCE